MAPASATTVTVTVPSFSSTPSTSSPTSHVGAIVGGLFAGIIAALLLAGLGYLLVRRHRRRRDADLSYLTKGKGKGSYKGEGSHPLLPSTGSELRAIRRTEQESEHNPYSDLTHPRPTSRITGPLTSSSVMQEIPSTSGSPPRPSLSHLLIPSSLPKSATVTVTPAAESTFAKPTAHGDDDDDDVVGASAQSSPSTYSQTSASTRFHAMWEKDANEVIPPVPPIPAQYSRRNNETAEEEEGMLLERGNTEKVSRLLKSRARHAHRGGSHPPPSGLSRSNTKTSHIERSGSLREVAEDDDEGETPSRNISLTIRNPFESTPSSRSTSVTTSSTSIANHTAYSGYAPPARRLSVIDNEDAERESLYADEISTIAVHPAPIHPLRIATKNRTFELS